MRWRRGRRREMLAVGLRLWNLGFRARSPGTLGPEPAKPRKPAPGEPDGSLVASPKAHPIRSQNSACMPLVWFGPYFNMKSLDEKYATWRLPCLGQAHWSRIRICICTFHPPCICRSMNVARWSLLILTLDENYYRNCRLRYITLTYEGSMLFE